MSELITKLSAKFDASEHKTHPAKGYTYVAIDKTIGRLNEVMGERYSTSILNTHFTADAVVIHTRISYTDENGFTSHRDGIGACPYPKKGMDIDDVVKTAYAESIKKGTHQWGVALYLWDDGERAEVEAEIKGAKSSTKSIDPDTPMIAEKQLQLLGIECNRIFGQGNDDAARKKIGEWVKREIVSRKALTEKEAEWLLKNMQKTPAGKYAPKSA